MTANEQIRAFIAIDLDAEVRHELQRVQATLRQAVPREAVRWVLPEQMHLTLRFLGNILAETIEVLIHALGNVASHHAPLRLRAQGVGGFPNLRRPRVIWAGLTGDLNALEALQNDIVQASRDYGKPEANRGFSPHLTIGRVREEAWRQAGEVGAAVAPLGNPDFGEWQVSHVRLMRSELSPKGARHSVLAEFPLAAPARL
jgi:2'-5' RNA ligase